MGWKRKKIGWKRVVFVNKKERNCDKKRRTHRYIDPVTEGTISCSNVYAMDIEK